MEELRAAFQDAVDVVMSRAEVNRPVISNAGSPGEDSPLHQKKINSG